MQENRMTKLVKWLYINGYKPPFRKETIAKAISSVVGVAPSTFYGYHILLRRLGVLKGALKKDYHNIDLTEIEKLEGTNLSEFKKEWESKTK